MVKNWNFAQKSKFSVKNRNFGQKYKFRPKIEIWSKIEIFGKNRKGIIFKYFAPLSWSPLFSQEGLNFACFVRCNSNTFGILWPSVGIQLPSFDQKWIFCGWILALRSVISSRTSNCPFFLTYYKKMLYLWNSGQE